MHTHTHVLPPPRVFNLSFKADWNHTANPSLISEWQALLFTASPSTYWKSGWLALFRWCDSDVFWSTSEQNTHSSTVNIKFHKSSLQLLGSWQRRLGYLHRDEKICWICSTQDRKRRFSEFGHSETLYFGTYNTTVISKETALFGLQETQSTSPGTSPVPICQVSNCIFYDDRSLTCQDP